MGNQSSRPSSTPSTKAAGTSEKSKTFEQFTELADDVAAQVFSALPLKEKAALARTSKGYYGLFSQHIHAAKCLMLVAHGDQTAADEMLRRNPKLLLERTNVTDYSGRTFKNITPYEYAYWAKDTHMCRMLERHMDDKTKAYMLERINVIEGIDTATGQPVGLVYSQRGLEHRSAHFDLTPLKDALQRYVDGYDNWVRANNWAALEGAWMEVGILQRNMPVHVLNEYCYPDRSFSPPPEFNEETLPRSVSFYNYNTSREQALFPLVVSDTAGLGIEFALIRAWTRGWGGGWAVTGGRGAASIDLAAVSRLDEVRTVDLTRSRENLQPTDSEASHSMGVQ